MGAHIPSQIAKKLEGKTFENFQHFSTTFWITIAEEPLYSKQFVTSQLNRIKKGWSPRAPFHDTAKGLRSYEICHLNPPHLGGAVYDMDNLRIMSAMQYALSSEIDE